MSRTVIAGCGIAGVTVACTLKDFLPEEEIVLIDPESKGLYSRIRLPEVLSGKLPEEKLTLTSPEALKEKGLDYRPGVELLALEPAYKKVICSDGELSYDRLVFATGASPSLPPVPGLTSEMTLRNLNDLHRVESELSSGKRALVIGGGLLGLEIAEALKNKELAVTVSEIADRLLPAVLTEKESLWLKNYLLGSGLSILTSSSVSEVRKENGQYAVTLNGRLEIFDMVLVSAGIVPNVKAAEKAGIKINRGICVDERFESSEKDIYAVGDCAEIGGRVYGLWMASKGQGSALAAILAGKQESYSPPVFSPVPKLPGISLKSLKEKVAELEG